MKRDTESAEAAAVEMLGKFLKWKLKVEQRFCSFGTGRPRGKPLTSAHLLSACKHEATLPPKAPICPPFWSLLDEGDLPRLGL